MSAELSPDELLHLAILDSRNGRHDEAIVKLKRCIAASPNLPAAYHMLAAEHAEIGMVEDAAREFSEVLRLDPASVAARFQLGLLRAVNNQPEQARRDWAPLGELDPGGPWSAFSGALECLIDADHASALRRLDAALAMDFNNAALRNDMTKLRNRLKASTGAAEEETDSRTGEMLLKSYRGNSEEQDN